MLTSLNRYAGLTLVEVLVALLVLSLGAFSLAIASAQSMRLAGESIYYSIAWAAGSDLLDVQWALLDHHPHLVNSASFSGGQPAPTSPGCALAPCSPVELQTFLQSSWQCSLGVSQGCPEREGLQTLPEFDAELLVNRTSGALRLRMEWRAKGEVHEIELESQVR